MRKITILIIIIFSFTKSVKAQTEAATAAAGVIAIAAAAFTVDRMIESLERNMVEWVLVNKNLNSNDKFELSLLRFNVTKKSELSNVQVFAYYYRKEGSEKEILLNVCSPGWLSESGVNFTYITTYSFNKEYWTSIMESFINLSKPKNLKNKYIKVDSIPTTSYFNDKLEYYGMSKIREIGKSKNTFESGNVFVYNENLNGDTHVIQDFDDNFKIDFNEGNLNLFIKKTSNLIRLKREYVLDLIKTFY